MMTLENDPSTDDQQNKDPNISAEEVSNPTPSANATIADSAPSVPKTVAKELDHTAVAPDDNAKKEIKANPPTVPSSVPPEEFDWSVFDKKGFGEGYSQAERDEITNLYSSTVASITEGEVVQGIIMEINDRDVILNIGFKSDGLVSRAEFKDLPDAKVGDSIDLFVEMRENAMGQLVLSRKKALLVKSWNNVQSALEKDTIMESLVKRRTKGGLIVDLCGIEAFLPGSQIDVKPIRDFNIYVGKSIEVKVVKINHLNNNIVVSHKALIEKDIEEQKLAILNNLEKGQVLEGVIKNMTNFGVFIDLGGVDGLLHITDISWERMNHPNEMLNLDQVVKVVVLDFDEPKKRISLGMKQLVPHPWDSLSADIEVHSRVKGKITNVVDYGAFLEIQPGVEGLIHVSEMSWSQHLRSPQDFMKVGDELEAVVLTVDREERKMSLGIKQLKEDPWTRQDLLTKYAIGTKHTGIVRNLTNFGLFVELEEGIDGLVHISDLSWSKNIKHPYEFTKVGDSLEVMVLELEVPLRRLSLSHKHMEDNPWDTFESIFQVGSVHKCMVLEKSDKGAKLELPYGIESFCAAENLIKKDSTEVNAGETIDFKVIEFALADRKIVMSHKDVWDVKKTPAPTLRKNKYPPKEKITGRPKDETIDEHKNKPIQNNMKSLRMIKKKMEESHQGPKKSDAKTKKEK